MAPLTTEASLGTRKLDWARSTFGCRLKMILTITIHFVETLRDFPTDGPSCLLPSKLDRKGCRANSITHQHHTPATECESPYVLLRDSLGKHLTGPTRKPLAAPTELATRFHFEVGRRAKLSGQSHSPTSKIPKAHNEIAMTLKKSKRRETKKIEHATKYLRIMGYANRQKSDLCRDFLTRLSSSGDKCQDPRENLGT